MVCEVGIALLLDLALLLLELLLLEVLDLGVDVGDGITAGGGIRHHRSWSRAMPTRRCGHLVLSLAVHHAVALGHDILCSRVGHHGLRGAVRKGTVKVELHAVTHG